MLPSRNNFLDRGALRRSRMSWLAENGELAQHMASLLETGEMSDVKFKVGRERRVFHLHRIPLCRYDSTLKNMLTGIEAGREIELLDDDPDAFCSMISCMYKNYFNVSNNEEACAVFRLTNKYQIPSVGKACISYMTSNLSVESVLKIYEVASELQEQKLESNCWKYIIDNKDQVINEDNLTSAKITTLKYLLKKGKFDEGLKLIIYKSVVNWALGECRKYGLEINTKNLRRFIQPLFPNTVLLSLVTNELLKRIKDEELDNKEKFVFVENVFVKGNAALRRCNSTNISRKDDDDQRVIVNNSVFTDCKGTKNISVTTNFAKITQRLVSNYVDVCIYGVVFYLSESKTKFVLPETVKCILTIRNVTRNVEVTQSVNKLDCCFQESIMFKNDIHLPSPFICFQECFIKIDEPFMIRKGEICEIVIEGKYKGNRFLYYCNGNCYFFNCYLENESFDSSVTPSFPKPHLHKVCLWNIITI